MTALIYRIRVAFWLWELSGRSIRDAWTYAPDAMQGHETNNPPISPEKMAAAYLKNWGIK